jgi:hypothetical protein
VAGTVLAIAFSSKRGATLTSIQDLLDLWENPAWLAYIAFVLLLAVALNVRASSPVQGLCIEMPAREFVAW